MFRKELRNYYLPQNLHDANGVKIDPDGVFQIMATQELPAAEAEFTDHPQYVTPSFELCNAWSGYWFELADKGE